MKPNRLPVLVSLIVAGLMLSPIFFVAPAQAERNPGPDLTLSAADIAFSKDKPIKGETVQINATIHNVGDANASTVHVRFYDGQPPTVMIGTEQTVDVPFGSTGNVRVNWSTSTVLNGTHRIFVVVDPNSEITEDNETNNSANKTIFVNLAPSIVASASTYTEDTWNQITFNATGSSDPDGYIKTYYWDFDDGNSSKGAEVNHAWSDNGVYNISVLITDDCGGTNSTVLQVTIRNRPPNAVAYDQIGYTLDVVTFDSAHSTDDDGYIAAARWTLRNNNTVLTGKKVTTIYPDDGVYAVDLNVTDDDSAPDNITFYITVVNREPVAHIDSTSLHINTSENVTFDGSASYDDDGYITNYTWIYPGGKKEYGVKTTHTFNVANGSYLVSLVVIDDDGDVDSTGVTVRVGNIAPVAVAGLSTVVNTFENVTFDGSRSNDPDGSIVTYNWNFGDGSLSNSSVVMHSYSQDGIYDVALIVTDNDGATDSDSLKVTVLNQAPFAFYPATVVGTFETVYLNGSYCSDVDGYIANFTWDLGGGVFLYGPEATTNFSHRGVYPIKLTIHDDDGASASSSFNVTVLNSPPRAFMSVDPMKPTEQELVTFNASSSYDLDGTITNYTWNFGDSTYGYGTLTTHRYLASGAYVVVLTTTDNDGASTTVAQNISVSKYNPPPVAAFSYSPASPTTTDIVEFNASGSYDLNGSIRKYEWSWGDGNQTQLTLPKISHRFYQTGVYNVTLTVTDDGGAKGSTWQELTVTPGVNHAPTAVIYAPILTAESGTSLTFDGTSSYDSDGAVVNYTWDFGDGTQAYFPMVSHSFTNNQGTPKEFTVTLVVKDDGSLTCSTSVKATINPPVPVNLRPRAVLTATPTTVLTKELVTLSARGSTDPDGSIASNGYTWSFGDGEIGSGEQVSHFYQKPGIYVVLLTVKDNLGAAGSATETIYVLNRVPSAKIMPEMTTVQTQDKLTFNASSSSDPDGEIVQYAWDLGDGTLSNKAVIEHTYHHSGKFAIKLTVTDDYGASTSASLSLTVTNRPPLAVLSGSNASAYIGDQLMFDGSRSNDTDGRIANYTWEFGDGLTASGSIVNHIFGTAGTYQVKLTVTDDSGDSSTATMTVSITKKPIVKPPKPPESKFIPGFELLVMAAALALALLSADRLRRK